MLSPLQVEERDPCASSDVMSPIPPRRQRDRIFSTPGRANDRFGAGLRIQIPADFRNPDPEHPIDKARFFATGILAILYSWQNVLQP